MPSDYRYNPFNNIAEPVPITGETHIIPSNSPYTIRLKEVPVKDSPSTVSLKIAGVSAVEVAAEPAAGQFRCDYTTGADKDANWNTGLIQFNAADAGKTVVAAYNGMGTLASANLHGFQLFTASGTFTVPKGVDEIYITVVGGGGGGGGGSYHEGGKGGAASAVYKVKFVVTPGVTFTVTCGNGGNGGNGGTSNGVGGSAGGTSSFGALVSASGGGGGNGSGIDADGAGADRGKAYPFSLGAASNGSSAGGAGYAGSTIWYGCGGGGGAAGRPAGGKGGNGAGGWILVEW